MLGTLPTELLDQIAHHVAVHIDPVNANPVCPGPRDLFHLAGVSRQVRPSALRALLDKFGVVSGVLRAFQVNQLGHNDYVAVSIANACCSCVQDHDRRLIPVCEVDVFTTNNGPSLLLAEPTISSSRVLHVPADLITTLQVGQLVDDADVVFDWNMLVLPRRLVRVLPRLVRLHLSRHAPARVSCALLVALQNQLVSLTVGASTNISWLADLTFPNLRCITYGPTTTCAFPAAPHLRALYVQSPVSLTSLRMHVQFTSYMTHLETWSMEYPAAYQPGEGWLEGDWDRLDESVAEFTDSFECLRFVRAPRVLISQLETLLCHVPALHIVGYRDGSIGMDSDALMWAQHHTNLTTLIFPRDSASDNGSQLYASEMVSLAQLPHLMYLECAVAESSQPGTLIETSSGDSALSDASTLSVGPSRPGALTAPRLASIQAQLASLGTVFPALATAKCSVLFFNLLAHTTLPQLRIAHVVVVHGMWSQCEYDITFPTLPELRVLQFDADVAGKIDQRTWTISDMDFWPTTIPRLERLVNRARSTVTFPHHLPEYGHQVDVHL